MKHQLKKQLCLAMALILTLALTAPALGAEEWSMPDYGAFVTQFVEDYQKNHAGELAAFDADAYFKENFPYYEKEEYMEFCCQGDEAIFREAMWQASLSDRADAAYEAEVVRSYRAAFPKELEKLDLNEILAGQGYAEPMAAYMQDRGYTDEGAARNSLYCIYVENREDLAAAREQGAEYEAAHPGSRAAFDAEAYYRENHYRDKDEFMKARSLQNDGEFADMLFAEWAERQSLVAFPDRYQQDPNAPIGLVANGQEVELPAGSAIYKENGVTYAPAKVLSELLGVSVAADARGYAPIRAAAEAAGWDVVWNGAWKSVVLLNQREIRAGLDKSFGKFDALLRRLLELARPEDGGGYLTASSAELRLTAFNSLDGDATASATVKGELVQKGGRMDLTLTLNAGDLLRLLTPQLREALNQGSSRLSFAQLKSLVTGFKVRLLLDLEQGTLYVNLPALAGFVEGARADTWYGFDLGLDGLDGARPDGGFSVGGVLYAQLLRSSAQDRWSTPEAVYRQFQATAAGLEPILGNSRVRESGGTLTYSLPTAVVNGMISDAASYLGEEKLPGVFKDYSLSLSVSGGGQMTMSMAVRPDMNAIAGVAGTEFADTALYTFLLNLFDFRMTASASGNGHAGSQRAEYHWKNQFRLDLSETYTRAATGREPAAAPPSGADLREASGPQPTPALFYALSGLRAVAPAAE